MVFVAGVVAVRPVTHHGLGIIHGLSLYLIPGFWCVELSGYA
jgi:hypothetical protein